MRILMLEIDSLLVNDVSWALELFLSGEGAVYYYSVGHKYSSGTVL